MSTYREIHGKAVKSVSSDPSDATSEGQIWYNTTSNTFKSLVLVESWASGENVPGTATRLGFASGTVTAGLYASGYEGTTSPPPANLMPNTSFEYDGTNWTSGGTFGTRRFIGASAGTQTASLAAGGNAPTGANRGETEEYNGTAWAEQSDMPTGNQGNTGAGIQTAALSISGSNDYDITLEYDGSSWTAGNNLTSARYKGYGSGTQTAAMFSGGRPPSPSDIVSTVEQYDGTNWTSNPASLGTGQAGYSSQNIGTSSRDATIVAGGGAGSPVSNTGATQIYDGTSWRTSTSMSTARETSLTGDSAAALAIAGYTSSNTAAVEEFSGAKVIQTLTQS